MESPLDFSLMDRVRYLLDPFSMLWIKHFLLRDHYHHPPHHRHYRHYRHHPRDFLLDVLFVQFNFLNLHARHHGAISPF